MKFFQSLTFRSPIAALAIGLPTAVFSREPPVQFEQVQAVFAEHCVKCHGPDKQRGGFRIDDRESAFAPADSGKAPIATKKSEQSEVFLRVTSTDPDFQMPRKGERLSDAEADLVRRWIDAGADWPQSDNPPPARTTGEMRVTDADRQHWSFQPMAKVSPPNSAETNPIDRFVQKPLQDAGLKSNPSASMPVLVRRMHYDVLGLPPSPATIDKLETSVDLDPWIDELLSDPAFGEHWARKWLDVVRYADSRGYEGDADEPNAYQYRDFVIRALNDDLRFDEFARWQIAGDELAPQNAAAVAATGFLAVGTVNIPTPVSMREEQLQSEADVMDDLVSTTGQAFLGLTLGCARCHDHKFDPIPTRDYYRMVRAFANVKRWNTPPAAALRQRDIYVANSKQQLREKKLAVIDCTDDERKWLSVTGIMGNESRLAHEKYDHLLEFTDKQWRATLSAEERQTLDQLDTAAAKAKPESAWAAKPALFVNDRSATPKPVHLLRRGDVSLPADEVDLGFLSVLTGEKSAQQFWKISRAQVPSSTTGQRAALADWLTAPDSGAGHLLARVAVNRIWQGYFGRGLVRSANDFGLQGDLPTHPELLDWLAAELIRNEWKMKPIHRLILSSKVYRQSSDYDEARNAIDPANNLLWRQKPKRLSAEAIRDAILAVSGRLNPQRFGPGIRPFIPTDAIATRSGHKWPENVVEGPGQWRRSVYIFIKRSVRFPMLESFDAPDPSMSCGRRLPTTVPIQSLTMLNNPFVRSSARAFGEQIEASVNTPQQRVIEAYQLALGRRPDESELSRALTFLDGADGEAADALTDLCHALFTLNEFVYIE